MVNIMSTQKITLEDRVKLEDRDIKLVKMFMNEDIKTAVLEVLESGYYIKGPNLKNFEASFRDYIGSKYAIGVSSGTSALFLAYQEIELSPGDEVIVPSHTFIATASPHPVDRSSFCAVSGASQYFLRRPPGSLCRPPITIDEARTHRARPRNTSGSRHPRPASTWF